MLKKLMKYDFRDQGKTLWPLHLALLLGSVLAGFCLLYYMSSLQKMAEGVMRISAMQVVSIVVMALVMIVEPILIVRSRRQLAERLRRQYRAEQLERETDAGGEP